MQDLFDLLSGATTNGTWTDVNGQYALQGGSILGAHLGSIDLTGFKNIQYSFDYTTGAAGCGDIVNVKIEPLGPVIHVTACSLYHDDTVCEDQGYSLGNDGENVICFTAEHCNTRILDDGDHVIVEVRKTSDASLVSSATLIIGQDPSSLTGLLGGTNNNWLPTAGACQPGDTFFGCYLESKILDKTALQTGIYYMFLKRPWMDANGLLGESLGQDMDFICSVKSISGNITGPTDLAVLKEGNYASFLMPFLGKQLANPRPGLASLWLNGLPTAENPCTGNTVQGFSLRNGSLSVPITEIFVDLEDDASFEDSYTSAHALLPLPPLVPPDPLNSCDVGGHSTDVIGYQFETYLLNNFAAGATCQGIPGDVEWTFTEDFDLRVRTQYVSVGDFTGTNIFETFNIFRIRCLGVEDLGGFVADCPGAPAPTTFEGNWLWDNTQPILIIRADANVYGNFTSIAGSQVTFFVNFNLSFMSKSSATSWTTEEVRVETAPSAGTFTTFQISNLPLVPGGPAGGLLPFPSSGFQQSRVLVHTFSTPGAYRIEGDVLTNNGWASSFTAWILVGTF